jgi:hypothetical protein
MTTLARFPNIETVQRGDLASLVGLAYRLGIEPDWLAAVISFESGFNPKAVNRYSNAAGLIQFMPATAKTLLKAASNEAATAQVLAMTFPEQLNLAEKYFAPYQGRMGSVDDVYLAVFYPAAIGTAPDHVVGRPGTAVYEQNKAAFDKEGKGYFTTSDITENIRSVLSRAQNQGRFDIGDAMGSGAEGGWSAAPTPESTGVAIPQLVAIGAAAVVLYRLLKGSA